MSKFFTLDFLINSFQSGKNNIELFHFGEHANAADSLQNLEFEFEPSQSSIDAIFNFASQYEVVKSSCAGNIELNLN
jgi:hypothetical protein